MTLPLPDSERTKAIKKMMEVQQKELTDVTREVREIRRLLDIRSSWSTAALRAIKQFLSHIDPNWKK